MLTVLLKIGICIFLLNGYFYPEKYFELIMSFSYKLIYLCSKAQIICSKAQICCTNLIKENSILLQLKNNLECKKTDTLISIDYVNNDPTEYNDNKDKCYFAIYSWLDNNTKCLNKKINYDLDETLTIYEISNIKFLLVELKVGKNDYIKINLNTDEFNFYIVGNIFTKQFFIHFVKHFLKYKEELKNDNTLKIKFIDQNVDIIEFEFTSKNESILLEKNSYKLLNYNEEIN